MQSPAASVCDDVGNVDGVGVRSGLRIVVAIASLCGSDARIWISPRSRRHAERLRLVLAGGVEQIALGVEDHRAAVQKVGEPVLDRRVEIAFAGDKIFQALPCDDDGLDVERAAFSAVWSVFLSKRTEADFEAWRRERDWTARKYAAWERGDRVLVR